MNKPISKAISKKISMKTLPMMLKKDSAHQIMKSIRRYP